MKRHQQIPDGASLEVQEIEGEKSREISLNMDDPKGSEPVWKHEANGSEHVIEI